MPFAADIRHWPTVAAFEAHLAQYDPAIASWAGGVVYHHTVIPTLDDWRGEPTVIGLRNYYAYDAPWGDGTNRKGWSAGPHLFIGPDGIFQLTPVNLPGTHAVGANETRWGIEVVGNYTHVPWSDVMAEFAIGAGAALLRWRGIAASRQTVQGHCDYNKPECPGRAIDLDWVAAQVAARIGISSSSPAPPAPLTPQSPILGARALDPDALAAAITRHPNGAYTREDVRVIVGYYLSRSHELGVDPLVALAQMCHETGWLSSAWSQRPRRNPAGIGVTGEPGKGCTFASWPLAVEAHLGRLLAYALPVGDETMLQHNAIINALAVRILSPTLFGAAPTVAGLAGRWATDTAYDQKLCAVARKLVAG